jgi:aminoglycoside N3'-acetyltransferase
MEFDETDTIIVYASIFGIKFVNFQKNDVIYI